MRLFKIFVCGFFLINTVNAQSRVGLMLGGGVLYYSGDMNDRVLTHEKLLRPFGNVGIIYHLSSRFDVWANFMHGQLAGADSLAIKYTIRNRNLSFKTDIDELGINIGYKILGDQKGFLRKAVPYIFTGIAGYHFKPKAEISGTWFDLQRIGTEGQYIKNGNYPKPYKLYQVSIPAGLGVEFWISKSFSLRVEAAYHFVFTDYLDDLSGTYPDSASLAAAPNGNVAVLLSSRLKEGDFPQKGIGRGNPATNDSYTHIGVSLLWTPHKKNSSIHKTVKKKKKKCDAYK